MKLSMHKAIKMMEENNGNLELRPSFPISITELPENLIVLGNLNISNSSFKSLPKGLKVNGNLFASFSTLEALPDDLFVGGYLNLSNCRNIKNLPENLNVEGNLILKDSSITEIPRSAKIGGLTYIDGTGISEKDLPYDIVLGDNSFLSNAPLSSEEPFRMKAEILLRQLRDTSDDELYVSEKEIDSITERIPYGDTIELPDGFKVNERLDLQCAIINKIPDNALFGSSLDLSDAKIRKMPERLVVGYDLILTSASFNDLPEEIIAGYNLYLDNTCVRELPTKTYVGHDLYLSNSLITKLPSGLKVFGLLDLSNTPIEELPEGFTVRDLNLSNTALVSMPKGLKVLNDLYISNVSSFPSDLYVGNDLHIVGNTASIEIPETAHIGGNVYVNNERVFFREKNGMADQLINSVVNSIMNMSDGTETYLINDGFCIFAEKEPNGGVSVELSSCVYDGSEILLDYPIDNDIINDNSDKLGKVSELVEYYVKTATTAFLSSDYANYLEKKNEGVIDLSSHKEIMKIASRTYKELILAGTSLHSLPDNLIVMGNLDLRYTPISELPAGLKIGGNLYLNKTEIEAKDLPKDLCIDGSIYIHSNVGYKPDILHYNSLKNQKPKSSDYFEKEQ